MKFLKKIISSCPETHYLAQAGFELTEILLPRSLIGGTSKVYHDAQLRISNKSFFFLAKISRISDLP